MNVLLNWNKKNKKDRFVFFVEGRKPRGFEFYSDLKKFVYVNYPAQSGCTVGVRHAGERPHLRKGEAPKLFQGWDTITQISDFIEI